MAFPSALFERSRATLIVLLALLIAGVVAFNVMPIQAEADIDAPLLTVTLKQTGIRAEDADRLLVRPVAQQLRTVAGVKELRSSAYAGGATIMLEFETPLIFGTPYDSARALALVRERLDLARADLPPAAKIPELQQVNPGRFPLLFVVLSGDVPDARLLRYARVLRNKLRALPAVADVRSALS